MPMTYRRLGTSGLKISSLSFGSWVTFGKQVNIDAAVRLMSTAYDGGVTFFDNAEGYEAGQAEQIMGEVLAKVAWRRDSYVVSSKVFWGKDRSNPKPTQEGLSRKHVIEACHAAMRRLRVDYLDLYFAHRPDPETPIIETVRAMSDLVSQGKVLYWGTSEWSAAQIIEAHEAAAHWRLVPPTMEQPQYNLLNRGRVEDEYRPLYARYGLGTTIWSPLASGLLTGKYLNGIPAGSRLSLPGYEWLRASADPANAATQIIRGFLAIATRVGISPARLAIAWCLRNPHVSSVILGASHVDQVSENLKAVDDVALITDVVAADIDLLLGGRR